MDIKDFYPSVTEKKLDGAIVFSKTNINISNDVGKSLLFHNTEAWKKNSESCFDVTMKSHDGVEVCELVEIVILSYLTKLINQNVGLYKDDGLIVVKNVNDQQTDKMRKSINQVFKLFGFKIEIKTNLIKVSFQDVAFRLIKGTFRPYKTPNNNLSYINVFSNHPPNIIKRSPNSISDLLSRNSCSKNIFDKTKD